MKAHDRAAGYPTAVHRPCRVSGGVAVHPGACAPLFQSGHRGYHPAVGGGAVGLSGADGQRARRALDPLHGNGHRAFLLIFMGCVEHHPAGSRVSLRPGVYSGRACRQRGVAAALRPLARPRPMGAPFFAAAGAGVWDAVRHHVLSAAPPSPARRALTDRRQRRPDGGHAGADRLCGEQSGLFARQRDQHEHFFHPHPGGFFRRADLICAARAAAGERFAQRACRHGRGVAPPVRAVQAQQGGHQPHQPAVP